MTVIPRYFTHKDMKYSQKAREFCRDSVSIRVCVRVDQECWIVEANFYKGQAVPSSDQLEKILEPLE